MGPQVQKNRRPWNGPHREYYRTSLNGIKGFWDWRKANIFRVIENPILVHQWHIKWEDCQVLCVNHWVCFNFMLADKKTPTRLDPWEIRDWRIAYWFHNIYDEFAFPRFLFSFLLKFLSFPFYNIGFLILLDWLHPGRHALGPTALGMAGCPRIWIDISLDSTQI